MTRSLAGGSVVEDEPLLGDAAGDVLGEHGAEVVGPASISRRACRSPVGRHRRCHPRHQSGRPGVIHRRRLHARSVPFLFATAYTHDDNPYADRAPLLLKPTTCARCWMRWRRSCALTAPRRRSEATRRSGWHGDFSATPNFRSGRPPPPPRTREPIWPSRPSKTLHPRAFGHLQRREAATKALRSCPATTNPQLKASFELHLEETQGRSSASTSGRGWTSS